nr:protein kinase [Lachnospiraceae bacterium]
MAKENFYPLALPAGTVLAGQFIIRRVLGEGGFGITYEAEDHRTGSLVAVKEYFPDSMATRSGSTQVIPFTGERGENFEYGKGCFLQEAETLAQFIGNENIIRVFTYFEENGTAYFVMEFVHGTGFDKYIRERGGRLSYEEAASKLFPVMDALQAVHEKGIIHRDVTPDNIYITEDGKVRLLDFGAARFSLGDRSRSLDVILKHGYAPREQYSRHGRQGPYTDVYSMAATFYFAITGRKPVDSIDRMEEDTLIAPSTLGARISAEREEAILKALSLDSRDRFQSMREFKEALLSGASEEQPESTAVNMPAPDTEDASGQQREYGQQGNTGQQWGAGQQGNTEQQWESGQQGNSGQQWGYGPQDMPVPRAGNVQPDAPAQPWEDGAQSEPVPQWNDAAQNNGQVLTEETPKRSSRKKLPVLLAAIPAALAAVVLGILFLNKGEEDTDSYAGRKRERETTPTPTKAAAPTAAKPVEENKSEAVVAEGKYDYDDEVEPYTVRTYANGDPIDLGGMEIIIRDWWSNPDTDIMQMDPDDLTSYEAEIREYREWAMEKYNFKLKSMEIGDWGSAPQDFVDYVTTGGDDHNYVFTLRDAPETASALHSGMMYDLSTLDCLDFYDPKYTANRMHEKYSWNGGIYAMYAGISDPTDGLFFNYDVIEAAGHTADEIYDMQKNGSWTWEAWTDIMDDVQALGKGYYGFTGNLNCMTYPSVCSNGGEFIGMENGKYV